MNKANIEGASDRITESAAAMTEAGEECAVGQLFLSSSLFRDQPTGGEWLPHRKPRPEPNC